MRKNRAKLLKKNPKRAKKYKKNKKCTKKGRKNVKPLKSTRQKRLKQSHSQIPYNELKATWYAKLKVAGFNDIETTWGELKSSAGHQSSSLMESASLSLRELYYRRLTNFVTHNANWGRDRLHNLVAALYIEGTSYRSMLPIIKAELKIKTSIWTIHKIVKSLETRSTAWNRTHPEGLDFNADLSPSPAIGIPRRPAS